jgi:serine O-acetyltransferase
MSPLKIQKLGNYLFRKKIPIIPKLITLVIRLIWGCYLPSGATIGNNVSLGYGGIGTVIHERTVIGNNCRISSNVTIGGTSKKYDVPKIGNSVYIGAGAVILGPIQIQDNVVIGANSVVTEDIPSACLVVGAPAKIKRRNIKIEKYI